MIFYHPDLPAAFVEEIRDTVAAWPSRGSDFLQLPLSRFEAQSGPDAAPVQTHLDRVTVRRTAMTTREDGRRAWLIEYGDHLSEYVVVAWIADNLRAIRHRMHENIDRMMFEAAR